MISQIEPTNQKELEMKVQLIRCELIGQITLIAQQ